MDWWLALVSCLKVFLETNNDGDSNTNSIAVW